MKQTYQEIEDEVRRLAHSLPPSDLGSTRAIQAVSRFIYTKLIEQGRNSASGGALPSEKTALFGVFEPGV